MERYPSSHGNAPSCPSLQLLLSMSLTLFSPIFRFLSNSSSGAPLSLNSTQLLPLLFYFNISLLSLCAQNMLLFCVKDAAEIQMGLSRLSLILITLCLFSMFTLVFSFAVSGQAVYPLLCNCLIKTMIASFFKVTTYCNSIAKLYGKSCTVYVCTERSTIKLAPFTLDVFTVYINAQLGEVRKNCWLLRPKMRKLSYYSIPTLIFSDN